MTAIRSVLPRVAAGTALLLAVGLVAGCGGLLSTDSEADGDQGAPAAAAEDETAGEESDVSLGDVDLSTDGEGGTVTLGDDDELSVTVGVDELPEWFPAEMPLPAEFTVLSATESQDDDGTLYGVILTTTIDFSDIVVVLDDGFAATGIEVASRDVGEMAGMANGMYSTVLDGQSWTVIVGDVGEDEETSLMYSTRTE